MKRFSEMEIGILFMSHDKLFYGLSSNDKEAVMSIPNFDADIFFECTGIRV